MYTNDFEIWQILNNLPDEKIQDFIVQAELYVRKRHPNAVLMFSTDRNGVVTHVGVYDARLLLNQRHNWQANMQYAPQLLGERFPFSDDWDSRYKIRYLQMVWEAIAFAILGDEVRKNRLVTH